MVSARFQEVLTSIDEGQTLRGWILNGYAQVEYLLGDIIRLANQMPEYEPCHARLPHRVEKRIAKVRELLQFEGALTKHRDEILWIIEAFEASQQTRHMLAHGFCTAFHTPEGDFGLQFRKWHREGDADSEVIRMFRLVDLEYERAQFTDVADRALLLSQNLHKELGLVGD
jgi:hypothetical protein